MPEQNNNKHNYTIEELKFLLTQAEDQYSFNNCESVVEDTAVLKKIKKLKEEIKLKLIYSLQKNHKIKYESLGN